MKPTKLTDIKHEKHQLDAQGQILGKISATAAGLLVGKAKPYFTRHLDCGDFVTVINAAKVEVTGKKETLKTYTRYSGYPAGLHKATLGKLRAEKPEEIIRHAVSGMLPNNKLKKFWMARLDIKS